MNAAQVEIAPLSEIVGAEVRGVDLRDVPEDVRDALREAWSRYSLLLFRNQELSTEQQIRFAEIFGPITRVGYPEGFSYVSNVDPGGNNPAGPLGFHFDKSFYPKPAWGLTLYAIEAPPEGAGGETLFANAKLAYRMLPDELRMRIANLTVRHRAPDSSKRVAYPGVSSAPDAPQADHPLVFPHPVTGEPILFLSRRHAVGILGLTEDESEALMDELTSYIHRPEIRFAHAWRPGDLVLFDNLSLQHGRSDFDPKHRRHLRRVQIA